MEASLITEITELLTAIAIGVSSAAVVTVLFIIIIVYKKKMQYYTSLFRNRQVIRSVHTPEMMLMKHTTADTDLLMGHDLDSIMTDEQWLNDVLGLIPHCLAILKNCRSLTERLATLAMGLLSSHGPGMSQVVETARSISNRVDEMVTAMYPPLNPKLLEARATSLTLAVAQLAIIAQYECRNRKLSMDWIEKSLFELDSHLSILRDASMGSNVISNYNPSSSQMSTATSYA